MRKSKRPDLIEEQDATSATIVTYLLHFDEPIKGRRHYIGSTVYERRFIRWREHAMGNGAAYTKTFIRAGIGFSVVKLFFSPNRTYERWLKEHRVASQLCPLCSPNLPQPTPVHYDANFWLPTIGTYWTSKRPNDPRG